MRTCEVCPTFTHMCTPTNHARCHRAARTTYLVFGSTFFSEVETKLTKRVVSKTKQSSILEPNESVSSATSHSGNAHARLFIRARQAHWRGSSKNIHEAMSEPGKMIYPALSRDDFRFSTVHVHFTCTYWPQRPLPHEKISSVSVRHFHVVHHSRIKRNYVNMTSRSTNL